MRHTSCTDCLRVLVDGGLQRTPSGDWRDADLPEKPWKIIVTDVGLTRSGAAFHEIRARILDMRIPPGAYLTESELVADLGFSKTPVREALTRLRQEGLVAAVARSGYRVAPVTVKDARDLMSFRTLLEGEAAALAAANGGDDTRLSELEGLVKASFDPADRVSIVKFLTANRNFHIAVAELSGNRRLALAMEQTLDQLQRIMHIGLSLTSRAQEIHHEHHDLLDAVKAGNAELARHVAIAQAQASQEMVMTVLLNSHAVLSVELGASDG